MKITLLGCGGSQGVPSAAGEWGVCDPANPRNRRRRPSILVQEGDTTVLVDTPPDLREQTSGLGIERLDGVIFTHAHADHLHGIDDLRAFNRVANAPIPIWATEQTLETIEQRFGYALQPIPPGRIYYKPVLVPNVAADEFHIKDLRVVSHIQDHGFSETIGLRFGRFAYSTDLVTMTENELSKLENIEFWIVDCARYEPHPTHAHVARVLEWVERLKPRRTVLTHMDSSLDYDRLRRDLPAGVEPGYDGLVIEF